jgi:hypothetical protein
VGQGQFWDYPARGGKVTGEEFSGRNHPCWPKPLGFGFAPVVLGLTEADVPPAPLKFAEQPLRA